MIVIGIMVAIAAAAVAIELISDRRRTRTLYHPCCIICGRPLPELRWWQRGLLAWLLEPPPFHDMTRDPACRIPGIDWP